MKNIFCIVIFCVLGFCPVVYSQSYNEVSESRRDEILDEIRFSSQKMNSFNALFLQEKTSNMLEDKMVSSGKMYYKKENKLRWEYTSPFFNAFILNGKRVVMLNDKGKTNISGTMNYLFRNIAEIMMKGIGGGNSFYNSKQFEIRVLDNGKNVKIEMLPISAQSKKSFSEISLIFNTLDFSVDKIILKDRHNGLTTISLTNKQFNKPIDDSIFLK